MLSRGTFLLGQAEGLAGRQEQAHELQQSKTLHDVVLMPAPRLSITKNLDRQGDGSGGEQEVSTGSLSNHLAHLHPQVGQCTHQHCIVAAAASQQQDHPDLHAASSATCFRNPCLHSVPALSS